MKSCPALAFPWTIANQAPLSIEFSRKEYWSGLPFPTPVCMITYSIFRLACPSAPLYDMSIVCEFCSFSTDLPNPGIEPSSPALQEDSLPTELSGKP